VRPRNQDLRCGDAADAALCEKFRCLVIDERVQFGLVVVRPCFDTTIHRGVGRRAVVIARWCSAGLDGEVRRRAHFVTSSSVRNLRSESLSAGESHNERLDVTDRPGAGHHRSLSGGEQNPHRLREPRCRRLREVITRMPADEFTAGPMIILTMIAAGLTDAGPAGVPRRDLEVKVDQPLWPTRSHEESNPRLHPPQRSATKREPSLQFMSSVATPRSNPFGAVQEHRSLADGTTSWVSTDLVGQSRCLQGLSQIGEHAVDRAIADSAPAWGQNL
jgi:hypothetical protein